MSSATMNPIQNLSTSVTPPASSTHLLLSDMPTDTSANTLPALLNEYFRLGQRHAQLAHWEQDLSRREQELVSKKPLRFPLMMPSTTEVPTRVPRRRRRRTQRPRPSNQPTLHTLAEPLPSDNVDVILRTSKTIADTDAK